MVEHSEYDQAEPGRVKGRGKTIYSVQPLLPRTGKKSATCPTSCTSALQADLDRVDLNFKRARRFDYGRHFEQTWHVVGTSRKWWSTDLETFAAPILARPRPTARQLGDLALALQRELDAAQRLNGKRRLQAWRVQQRSLVPDNQPAADKAARKGFLEGLQRPKPRPMRRPDGTRTANVKENSRSFWSPGDQFTKGIGTGSQIPPTSWNITIVICSEGSPCTPHL